MMVSDSGALRVTSRAAVFAVLVGALAGCLLFLVWTGFRAPATSTTVTAPATPRPRGAAVAADETPEPTRPAPQPTDAPPLTPTVLAFPPAFGITPAASPPVADPPVALPSPAASPGVAVERSAAALEMERAVGEALDELLKGGSAAFFAGEGADRVSVLRGADERRVSASTIKLALLLEVLREEALGELDLGEPYTIKHADVVGGTGELQNQVGKTLPYREIVRLMVTKSDNVATNVLLRKIGKSVEAAGMDRVNVLMADLGFPATRFERTMLDTAAQQQGRENYTSAHDLARMLEGITRGTMLADFSPKISEQALKLLEERGRGDKDWLGLRLETGWSLAHINGTLETVRNDAGIITGPAGQQAILAICLDRLTSAPDGERRIAEIGKRIQEIVQRR